MPVNRERVQYCIRERPRRAVTSRRNRSLPTRPEDPASRADPRAWLVLPARRWLCLRLQRGLSGISIVSELRGETAGGELYAMGRASLDGVVDVAYVLASS